MTPTPPDAEQRAVQVTITGRVQGVGFRAWVTWEAQERGLQGWVCNLSDGGVRAVFAGPDAAVEAMLAACHRGPSLAIVRRVQTAPWDGPIGPGFEVRYDR